MGDERKQQIKRRNWREREEGSSNHSCSCYGHHYSASQVLREERLMIFCVPKKEHKKLHKRR